MRQALIRLESQDQSDMPLWLDRKVFERDRDAVVWPFRGIFKPSVRDAMTHLGIGERAASLPRAEPTFEGKGDGSGISKARDD